MFYSIISIGFFFFPFNFLLLFYSVLHEEHRNFSRRILGTKVSDTARKKSLCIVAHGRDDTKIATQEEWHMWTTIEEWSTYTTVMLQGLHYYLKGIDTWRGMWAPLGRQHAAWWYGSGATRGLHEAKEQTTATLRHLYTLQGGDPQPFRALSNRSNDQQPAP